MKRLISVLIIHERKVSSRRRDFVAAGTSIACSGFSGGAWVISEIYVSSSWYALLAFAFAVELRCGLGNRDLAEFGNNFARTL
jgi:hypothetical protein